MLKQSLEIITILQSCNVLLDLQGFIAPSLTLSIKSQNHISL